jgi:hypothetical protein
MNWTSLHRQFEQNYNTYQNIYFNTMNDDTKCTIHPTVKLSAIIGKRVLKNKDNNRIVIILPKKYDIALWISLFCAIDIHKDESKGMSTLYNMCEKGQKVLLNGCFVEFECLFFDKESNRKKIRIKCKNNIYIETFTDNIYQFELTSSNKALSKNEQVSRKLNLNEMERKDKSTVLGLPRAFSNNENSVILVSKIGDTEKFIDENYINENKIKELILCGKINPDGEIKTLHDDDIIANPSLLISIDLYRIENYFEEHTNKTKGIIIDGLSKCIDDLQVLDEEILNNNIPVIVFTDHSDIESIRLLEERDFIIWQWDKEKIISSNSVIESLQKFMPFYSINTALLNHTNLNIVELSPKFNNVDMVISILWKLNKAIDSTEEGIAEIISNFYFIAIDLLRIIRIPSESELVSIKDKVNKLMERTYDNRLWLSEDILEKLDEINQLFMSIDVKKFAKKNHKIETLRELIEASDDSHNIAIIVSDKEKEKANDYWSNFFNVRKMTKVNFYTIKEICKSEISYQPNEIIVCGWLGSDRMYRLMNSYVSSKITLLLYSSEREWYSSSKKRWRHKSTFPMDFKKLSELLGIPEEELFNMNGEQSEGDYHIKDKSDDIIDSFDHEDFELRMNIYNYSSFVSNNPMEYKEAKAVKFTNGQFVFFTEKHKSFILTDLIEGNVTSSEVPIMVVEKIKDNDYILFRETDTDIIRETADKLLIKEGYYYLREKAELWKTTLLKLFDKTDGNIQTLYKVLKKHGCTRHAITIKNWMYDEDKIGPREKSDIDIIFRASGDESLIDTSEEVFEAISKLRGVHHQASTYLQKKLIRNISSIIRSEESIQTDGLNLEIDEFGKISILKIEEIGETWLNIDSKHVNKLLSEENNQWLG